MTIHFRRRLACAAAIAASVAVPSASWATAYSKASLLDVGYVLTDLDGADGVTSSVSFTALSANYVSATAGRYTDYGATLVSSTQNSLTADGLLGLAGVQASESQSNASARIVAGSGASLVSLHAEGAASGGPDAADLSSYAAYVGAPSSASFSLSANTSITLYALVDLAATTTVGYSVATGGGEYATAYFSMWIDGTGSNGTGYQYQMDADGLFAAYQYDTLTGLYSPESYTLQRLASVSFTNLSSSTLKGTLAMDASVYGESAASPVPEPSLPALALGGLTLLAGIRRFSGKAMAPPASIKSCGLVEFA